MDLKHRFSCPCHKCSNERKALSGIGFILFILLMAAVTYENKPPGGSFYCVGMDTINDSTGVTCQGDTFKLKSHDRKR